MKKIAGFLLLGMAFSQVQAKVCLGKTDELKIPDSPSMIAGDLEIYAWKFSCTKIKEVALGFAVKNVGTNSVKFQWNDISYTTSQGDYQADKSSDLIGTDEFVTKHFYKNPLNYFHKMGTQVSYKTEKALIPAFAYGSSSGTTDPEEPTDPVEPIDGDKVSSVSGLWFDAELEGTGFNFIDATGGLSVMYYGYSAAGNVNWLSSVTSGPKAGKIVIGKDYTLDLNLPSPGNGGTFSKKPTGDVSGTMSWGKMTINFTNCNTAKATLKGLDGEVEFDLTKLSGNAGVTCSVVE